MSPRPTDTPPRVALVSMPWSQAARPSAALGVLSAYVGRELPEVRVDKFFAYVDVAAELGARLYDLFAEYCYSIGEMSYLPELYPERRDDIMRYVAKTLGESSRAIQAASTLDENIVDTPPSELMAGETTWAGIAERTVQLLHEHTERLAARLVDGGYEIVGLTTCFGQVFPNVALANAIKRRAPEVVVVLGGSSVSAKVGPSLLREYASIDFVIQGEGERPLTELLRRFWRGEPLAFDKGLLGRDRVDTHPNGVPLWEVGLLDELPLPNYDEYASRAKALGLSWEVPIEGSRGCWWDRIKKTGDPKDTCYFCNLNVQWNGYRQKSEARIVEEVRALGDRYANGRVFFLDNIIRHQGVERLAEGLKNLDRDLEFFYELRANVSPLELASLWEAGLRRVQVGVEALSTSMLKRIGKGTTALQNLQIMKTLFELDIQNGSNLIIGFPTSTAEEVADTVTMIEQLALPYEPLQLTFFELRMGTTTDLWSDKFGLSKVENSPMYQIGLPREVWSRLAFMTGLAYESEGPVADWSPVLAAVEAWRRKYEEVKRRADPLMLSYEDGGTYLRIRDRRHQSRDHVLRGNDRLAYLFCTQIRTIDEVVRTLATSAEEQDRLRALLDRLTERRLVCREGEKVLSLATARSPEAAVRRIRMVANMSLPPLRKVRSLPVVPEALP